jgi:hypothetical protein
MRLFIISGIQDKKVCAIEIPRQIESIIAGSLQPIIEEK